MQRLVSLPGRRYVFVGGKGGVGKTSTSAATAVKFADEGLRTLVWPSALEGTVYVNSIESADANSTC